MAPQPYIAKTAPQAAWGSIALARFLHGVVALAAAAGIGLELSAAVGGRPGIAPTHLERFLRLFSYFTIDSNLLVGGVCALLAFRPAHDGRLFRVLRLTAVLCIAVTGIVFHTVLTGLRGAQFGGRRGCLHRDGHRPASAGEAASRSACRPNAGLWASPQNGRWRARRIQKEHST